jgi:hypothetical protein
MKFVIGKVRFERARCIVTPVAAAALAVALLPALGGAATPLGCEIGAAKSLDGCLKRVAKEHRKCFNAINRACDRDDERIVRHLEKLSDRIAAKCGSDANVQAAGFATLTLAGLEDRLRASCIAESDALIARSFGGPHAPTWAAAAIEERHCMEGALKNGSRFLATAARVQTRCIARQRKGGNCNLERTRKRLDRLASKAETRIERECGALALRDLISLAPATFVERTGAQAECATAISHPDVSPLALQCGPRDAIEAPTRGNYLRIVLDEAEWGTRCGTGNPYAFWVRLAPPGYPVENVVLQMQGGGVCLFEDQCNGVSAGLWSATDNNAPTGGIMSNSETVSPFANWTKVYLPYCTQDLFIGGGATNVWPSITVDRYGAINTRVALRYLRDILWRELDGDAEGYRPDRIRMLFGGTSAGGFGALYNYHYVLDDLQWTHTSAWADSALALHNGELIGIGNLGLFFFNEASPIFWDSRAYMPPYCTANICGVGPIIYAASEPRLKREPEQQFLVLSNQVDNVQVNTSFFSSTAAWVNAMRQSYCDTAGTEGLRYFLPAGTASNHTIVTDTSVFTGVSVDGMLMRDWLALAVTDPDGLSDAVEEGTLATVISGVDPFPCAVD